MVPSGLLDFVLHALRALRPCDPRNVALDSEKPNHVFFYSEFFAVYVPEISSCDGFCDIHVHGRGEEELGILVVGCHG